MRGYYSLIQYCPDSDKAEAANIGVVLLCPERHFIQCKIASANDRPRRFFGIQGEELERLDQIKLSFERRIEIDQSRLWKLEDFVKHIESRANQLTLTHPRNMHVTAPEEDLEKIFKELVGGRALGEPIHKKGQGISARPFLRQLFSRPELKPKIRQHVSVKLGYGPSFKADYAFRNGKESFVIPQTIHVDIEQTFREAELLAVRGNQLAKKGFEKKPAELIVPLPEPTPRFKVQIKEVAALLREYKVKPLAAERIEELAEQIRRHAHPV